MSDFTKQDLQMLYNMIIHVRNDYPALINDKDCTDLKNKIKEKIEREERYEKTKIAFDKMRQSLYESSPDILLKEKGEKS
jgi:hypothetical protein